VLSSYQAATAPGPDPEPGTYAADWDGGNAGEWRGESIGE
jgi:hypothetical protein